MEILPIVYPKCMVESFTIFVTNSLNSRQMESLNWARGIIEQDSEFFELQTKRGNVLNGHVVPLSKRMSRLLLTKL